MAGLLQGLLNWLRRGSTPAPGPSPLPPPAPTGPHPQDPVDLPAVFGRLLELHNQARQKVGAAPLLSNTRLEAAARKHAAWMAAHATLDHYENGVAFTQRITREGFLWRAAGENIASGQRTADAACDAWMNSTGHRRNILNKLYDRVGFGVAASADGRLYWCADFAAAAVPTIEDARQAILLHRDVMALICESGPVDLSGPLETPWE